MKLVKKISFNRTPLYLAIASNSLEIVKVLLENKNIDVNIIYKI